MVLQSITPGTFYLVSPGPLPATFDARHDGRVSTSHGVSPILQFVTDSADDDGRLTANAPAPHTMQSTQQPVRTAA